MKKTVIFVDIDGPLLPGKLHLLHQNRLTGKDNIPVFDQFSVIAFNLWAEYSEAEIVFSTNWAINYTSAELKHIMRMNGLAFNYHSDCITPKKPTSDRAQEIMLWLEYHPEVENFIAVDDDSTCEYIARALVDKDVTGKWIEVDYRNGISYENFRDGLEALYINQDIMFRDEYGVRIRTQEEIATEAAALNAFM